MQSQHQEPWLRLRVDNIGGRQRPAAQILCRDDVIDDPQQRVPLRTATRPGRGGQCPLGQVDEIVGITDLLLPNSSVVDHPHAQCVMVIDHRGQNRRDIGRTYPGIQAQDQRHPPATRFGKSIVEEAQDVRRDLRIQISDVLTGQSAGGLACDQGVGQCTETGIVVEVLGGEFDTFVRRGHRDADRNQRVTADLEEIVSRRNRFHPKALRPDPLQGCLHLCPSVHRCTALTVGRRGLGC